MRLSLFLTFRANVRISIITPSSRSLLLSFYLEWSFLFGMASAVCIFVNLCSTVFCGSNKVFSLVWFYFLSDSTKEVDKN